MNEYNLKKSVIDDIPTNWLDSLFDKYLKRNQDVFDCKDVEEMFLNLKKKLEKKYLK